MLAGLPTPRLDSISMARAEKSFRYYAEYAWEIVEPNVPFIGNWHIDLTCDVLQAVFPHQHLHNVMINMPPRHMKTVTISQLWLSWLWGPAGMPDLRSMNFTYAIGLAGRDGNKMRQLVKSPWYQSRWGHRFRLRTKEGDDTKTIFRNDKGGFRLSTTCPRGAATGEGGHMIVVDDAQKAQDAQSESSRDELRDWWRGTMSTRLNDPLRYARVLAGQRLHQMDIFGILEEEVRDARREGIEIDWTRVGLPARLRKSKPFMTVLPDGRVLKDPRTDPEEPLWKTRFDDAFLRRLEVSLGPWSAAGQLYQSPTPEAGGMYTATCWKRWTRLPDRPSRLIVSVDAAFKAGDGTSFVVILTAVEGDNKLFVVRRLRARLDWMATKLALLENLKWCQTRWNRKPNKWLIEEKANGAAICSEFEATFGKDETVPINPGQDSKAARANAAAPYVHAGMVMVPESPSMPSGHGIHFDHRDLAWDDATYREWWEEFEKFPNGEADDQVDANSQLTLWWRETSNPVFAIPDPPALVRKPEWGAGTLRPGWPGR
jgi:phage terminase large subunit-like protein